MRYMYKKFPEVFKEYIFFSNLLLFRLNIHLDIVKTDSKINILKCIYFPKTKKWSTKNGVKIFKPWIIMVGTHMLYLEYNVKVEIC